MRLALFSLLLVLLASCSKEPEAPVYAPAGGTWTFDGSQTTASFSDITERKGFQLSFSDRSATATLRFLFRARPAGDAVFIAAADTSRPSYVGVNLEVGGRGYHAASSGNGEVAVKLENGKLYLTAAGIRMKADSGATERTLDFKLKEY